MRDAPHAALAQLAEGDTDPPDVDRHQAHVGLAHLLREHKLPPGGVQSAVQPPSMTIEAPVMSDEASLAK